MEYFMNSVFWSINDFFYRAPRIIKEKFEDYILPGIKYAIFFPFAVCGCEWAQMQIARICYFHSCEWNNNNQGDYWVEKAVRNNNPLAYVYKGSFCLDKEISIECENQKKHIYETTDECKVLIQEAMDWFKKAAEMNCGAGQLHVYQMYNNWKYSVLGLTGNGDEYLWAASENGVPNADFMIAHDYMEKEDYKNALFYFEKAARAKKGRWIDLWGSKNETKKILKSVRKCVDAINLAEEGNPKGYYDYGEFIIQDGAMNHKLDYAHSLNSKAAELRYPKAMEKEAGFIIHGWVKGSLEDAFNYYARAVEAGVKEAHWGLGDCYFYGWGTEQNYEKAKYHLKKAKRYGYRFAARKLKSITTENIKDKIDGKKALEGDRDFYN